MNQRSPKGELSSPKGEIEDRPKGEIEDRPKGEPGNAGKRCKVWGWISCDKF